MVSQKGENVEDNIAVPKVIWDNIGVVDNDYSRSSKEGDSNKVFAILADVSRLDANNIKRDFTQIKKQGMLVTTSLDSNNIFYFYHKKSIKMENIQ